MDPHALRVLEFDKIIARLQDQAASALGRHVAALTYPVTDLEAARRRQKETTEARDILDLMGNIPLGGVEDIRPLVERASIGGLLQAAELLSVADTLRMSSRLSGFLAKLRQQYPVLGELALEIERFDAVESEIEKAISQNAEVLDSASPALAKTRSELKTIHSRLMERMNSFLQGHYRTIIQEPVITIRSDRYCIPVKAEHRGQFPGIVHDSSASGATIFVEPAAVVEMGNRRRELMGRERDEIEKVLTKLSRLVGDYGERILASLNVVATIDCIVARAKLSLLQGASEPILNNAGRIDLRSARHPLLTGDVVPIDVTLGKHFDALLITGPNTGGKTVTLKTIGLISLMAASGLHVPAAVGSEVAIFEEVFADIGDEQSIEQSLSTFSSHMTNIVSITRSATPNSLVLLDEIGAGTDPAEGAALAKAVLDYLLERGARVVATTHYGELKEFAFLRDSVENACVEFDPESLKPTYRLLIGVPGSSNAFAIAQRLGLANEIVTAARTNLSRRSEVAEELIRRIEESHRIAAEQQKIAERCSDDAEALRLRYEEQLRRLEAARSQAEYQAWARAEAVINAYSSKLDRTLQQLSVQHKDSKRAHDLRKKAQKLIDQLEEQVARPTKPESREERLSSDAELVPGARVRIADVDQDGKIVEPPEEGKVVVLIGAMRVKVPISALRKPRGETARRREVSTHVAIGAEKARDFVGEIHLRGKRVESALLELDKYLDDALAAGAVQVRIVHGKGTGAMRAAVWEYLRSHRGVESYRLGEKEEGGSGVTVAVMKR